MTQQKDFMLCGFQDFFGCIEYLYQVVMKEIAACKAAEHANKF